MIPDGAKFDKRLNSPSFKRSLKAHKASAAVADDSSAKSEFKATFSERYQVSEDRGENTLIDALAKRDELKTRIERFAVETAEIGAQIERNGAMIREIVSKIERLEQNRAAARHAICGTLADDMSLPAPVKAAAMAISTEADFRHGMRKDATETFRAHLETLTPEQRALEMMKLSLANPQMMIKSMKG